MMEREERDRLPIYLAVLPIIALLLFVILDYNVWKFEDVRLGILFATTVAVAIGIARKIKWSEFEESFADNIKAMSFAFMFILLIGLLIAAWSMSGIIPTLVYYGISLISPQLLLVTAFISAGVLATALGSSWTTMGTLGVAVMAIGTAQGFEGTSLAMLAGAVVSGSYLGDKISPLSDTTVLAANSSKVDIWAHFRGNLLYSGIAAGLSAVFYLVLGFTLAGSDAATVTANIEEVKTALAETLTIEWFLVLPFLLIAPIIIFKLPAIPALLGLSMVGIFIAMGVQGLSIEDAFGWALWGTENILADALSSADKSVGQIVYRGGIDGQSWTLILVFFAAIFVGALETIGAIEAIGYHIKEFAKTARLRIASSVFASAFFSVISGDQYVGLTVAPKLMGEEFDELDIDRRNLSRSAEDGGTCGGVLVPWTGCGATAASALGVSALAYAPFAFFPLLSIGLGILLPIIGFGIIGASSDKDDYEPRERKEKKPKKKKKEKMPECTVINIVK